MIEMQGPMDIIIHDETLCAYRDGKVVFIDGKPVKVNRHEFKITCNVQPLGARDLLMVPELDRYKELYTLYIGGVITPERSMVVDVHDNDIVHRLGKSYQVQGIENWGSYQKARIMLIDVGELANG